ncbi:MAG: OmpA family protein [Alcaligenaceae bacterium]|nr:OmpA family protein [Alcaligenaceae bacterium]
MAKLDKGTNYFASMTDLMVGVLFVFVLMIAYFAFQITQEDAVSRADFQQEQARTLALEGELAKVREQLEQQHELSDLERYVKAGAEARDLMVEQVIADLGARGIEARSVQSGVVTISGKGLFAPGRSDLDSVPGAVGKVDELANVLADYVNCFASRRQGGQPDTLAPCNSGGFVFESVFIEGHTDNQALLSVLPDGSRSNLELSARRATNTYEALIKKQPALTRFKNPAGQQVLSVAAYGEQRPIASNRTEAGRQDNRRIDIRFVMYVPRDQQELEKFLQSLGLAP